MSVSGQTLGTAPTLTFFGVFGRPLTPAPTTVGPAPVVGREDGPALKLGISFLALAAWSCLFVQMFVAPPLAQYL